jgi:hypothetical protein
MSLVKCAYSAYRQGNYAEARRLYRLAAQLLGDEFFAVNIQLCDIHLHQLPARVWTDRLKLPSPQQEGANVGHDTTFGHEPYHEPQLEKALTTVLDVSEINPTCLRVLSLLDKFSEECIRPDVDLIPLDRKNWRAQLEDEKLDMFFAESVWRGNSATWNYCMTKLTSGYGDDLRLVLAECRERGIPTVFWNKEDPANFDVFIEAAKLFDHVFTTDIGCIDRYKSILGHDRINVLPFAAQPRMHNPVLSKNREPRVSFAGSWNGVKYPDRAKWLDVLLSGPLARGLLDIYDRYAVADQEELRFPEPLSAAVRGSVPYEEIAERVYKRYSAMINVNSVEDSPTMVARRIFELGACGTPIISSPSPALEGEFSEFVDVAINSHEAMLLTEQLITDELAALRRSVRGVRQIHGQHTYLHRMRDVQRTLNPGFKLPAKVTQPVTAICVSKRPEFLNQIAGMLNEQTYDNIRVIFVIHGDDFDEAAVLSAFDARMQAQVFRVSGEGTVLADGLNLAIDHAQTNLLAKFDDDDYYGPNYLLDAILAFSYSDAGLVGKNTYFCYVEQTNQFALRFPSKHYRLSRLVHGGTLVWNRQRTGNIKFERVRQGTDTAFLKAIHQLNIPILSTDPFNFVHIRYRDLQKHTWKITDKDFLSKAKVIEYGLNLSVAYA